MDNSPFRTYKVEDRSFVAFVKREIHSLVKTSFNEIRTAEIDIVVSELTSNLIKYANGGELLYRLTVNDDTPLFELICIDNGPGIADVNFSLKDGISTKNTLGHGLGSISRLSNLSQIYSNVNWGTVIYCRFYEDAEQRETASRILARVLNVPYPGEAVSGDGCKIKEGGYGFKLLVGDGLGHGNGAKEAVDQAIETFYEAMENDPSSLLRLINKSVKKTRGLVASVVKYDQDSKTWEVCGVGNINTRLYNGLEYRSYTSNNGIVGMTLPNRLENTSYKAERFQQMILCSDGIKTNWDLGKYPQVIKYDPMILAACLYKDFGRRTDDMTVCIVKLI